MRETLRAGDRSTIRLAVKDVHSGRPVVGATIVVRLLGGPTSQELFSGCTDEEGRVAVDCELPARPGTKDAVVCEAQAGELTAEVRHKLSRVTRASV